MPQEIRISQTRRNKVIEFKEKLDGEGSWISAGYFVIKKEVLEIIEDDNTIWEDKPLKTLAEQGQLNAYFHDGFWQPMDTLRDKRKLEDLWENQAPWKIW